MGNRIVFVVFVVFLAVGAITGCASADQDESAASRTRPAPVAAPNPDLVERLDSNNALASCAYSFSDETLRDRAFAFDGTVLDVRRDQDPKAPASESDMNRVEFEVHEWFSGGDDSEATVWVPAELITGDRVLISGEPRWGGAAMDDAIAWLGCGGFTVAYSDGAAESWRSATN